MRQYFGVVSLSVIRKFNQAQTSGRKEPVRGGALPCRGVPRVLADSSLPCDGSTQRGGGVLWGEGAGDQRLGRRPWGAGTWGGGCKFHWRSWRALRLSSKDDKKMTRRSCVEGWKPELARPFNETTCHFWVQDFVWLLHWLESREAVACLRPRPVTPDQKGTSWLPAPCRPLRWLRLEPAGPQLCGLGLLYLQQRHHGRRVSRFLRPVETAERRLFPRIRFFEISFQALFETVFTCFIIV